MSDNGRGTDTRIDEHGSVVRKPVMATPDVRFVDPATSPLLPDGLPRRGMSAVAALSALLVHENHRESGSWSQTYRHGIPDTDLAPSIPRRRPGTVVAFWATVDGPDRTTAADLAAFPDLDVRISEPPGAATPAPR